MLEKFINQMEPWYGEEERKAVEEYLQSGGWITEYKKSRKLETMIAERLGVKFCSLLPNGTLTLWAAMSVLDIGQDDEVIVPDFTMVATPNAVKLVGAKPVFVDIDKENLCLDIELTKKAITAKTKAIILVSINGRCPQIKDFVQLAQEKGLYLIEDAAQSFGSQVGEQFLGTFGTFGSFSFSMPKIITMGQGGALVTNDEEKYRKLLKFRDFGRAKGGADDYEILGYNLKFTDLQAVFGIAQMKKLAWRIKRKKEIFKLYRDNLTSIPEIKMVDTNLEETTPWFIDILAPDPDGLAKYLKENNIGARRFYPALHKLPFYNVQGDFPVSNYISQHGLWLPSASQLKDEEINYVCEKIIEFYAKTQ